jgi:SAM-dependent methyltransferase
MPKEDKEWFEEWFDSPYYDLLYSKRNETEASFFIDNLLNYISLQKNSTALDLACGKGRHSIYLHQKGLNVTGLDLSKRSIDYAKQFEKDGLKFGIQDMRIALEETKFDLIVNLFTSFGYFDDLNENIKVLKAVKKMLKPNGTFVFDYLNGDKLRQTIVNEETKSFPEAEFKITRKLINGFVVKDIELKTNDFTRNYQEKVRLFNVIEFGSLFKFADLHIIKIAGNYQLDSYDPSTSDRIIIFATH